MACEQRAHNVTCWGLGSSSKSLRPRYNSSFLISPITPPLSSRLYVAEPRYMRIQTSILAAASIPTSAVDFYHLRALLLGIEGALSATL